MAVDSVNNNNAGLYATSGAVLGAGAGAGAAYLTRPFLKDGAPTDSFVKGMKENLTEIMTADEKEVAETMENSMKEFSNTINNAQSVDEIKNILKDSIAKPIKEIPAEDREMFKYIMEDVAKGFEQMGFEITPETKQLFSSVDSPDECLKIYSELIDKEFNGKTLEEVKNSFKTEMEAANKKAVKATFEQFWDAGKKTFKNCEDGAGKAIKKAARAIQGKYALIYGGIGAGVLGLAGYLCGAAGKKEAPQKVAEQ
jgi:gas vesicle protein